MSTSDELPVGICRRIKQVKPVQKDIYSLL